MTYTARRRTPCNMYWIGAGRSNNIEIIDGLWMVPLISLRGDALARYVYPYQKPSSTPPRGTPSESPILKGSATLETKAKKAKISPWDPWLIKSAYVNSDITAPDIPWLHFQIQSDKKHDPQRTVTARGAGALALVGIVQETIAQNAANDTPLEVHDPGGRILYQYNVKEPDSPPKLVSLVALNPGADLTLRGIGRHTMIHYEPETIANKPFTISR